MENQNGIKTVIAEDVEIMGSIKCASNIRIDGRLNGDLTCTGQAVIGEGAHVKGNLSVDSVTISGHINGNIAAKDRIELKATANVNGDLRGKRLTVVDGVTYVGKAEINPSSGGTRSQTQGEGRKGENKPKSPQESPQQGSDNRERQEDRKSGIFNRK